MIDKTELLLGFTVKEKVELFKQLYAELSGYGQDGDTELAHVNPYEVALLKSVGGSGTVNNITGLREYKGGGSSAPPPAPTTQTVKQETTIPDELKPYVKDILAEAQAQFQAEKATGYTPYAGQQLATFTPEQQQAFEATRTAFGEGLAGTPLGASTTYFAPALGATTAATMPTTAENIRAYMDPYLENVLRVQEQEARRADEISRQGRAAQAIQAGAFGGSREAVVEAEAQRALEDRLAALRASGMSQAFGTAQQMAEAQRQRELTAGRQYAALGTEAAAQQAREIGGLAATGEALRGQQQAALDLAKSQFIEERAFPQTQLQQYSSIIRGFPLTPSQLETKQTVTPQPSLTQQLLGAGIGAAGLAGAFGAFKGVKEGGLVGLAGGGRPMDAEPKRSRAELMGTAIGDLAGRMGAGRESVTSGGLRSMAPKMLAEPSFGMDDMPQEMQTATPMQMPSQRFMNEGGKVGYYQYGTLSSTIGMPNPMIGPLSGFDFRKNLEQVDQAEKEGRITVQDAMKARQELLQRSAQPTPEQQKYLERLKGIDFAKRQAETEEEYKASTEALDQSRYLALAKAGLGIASQDGSKGLLGGIASGIMTSGALDDIAQLARDERNLAREKRKELRQISESELDNLAKVAGISKDQATEMQKAEIQKYTDTITNANQTIDDARAAAKRGREAAQDVASEREKRLDYLSALAKAKGADKEKQSTLAGRIESLYKTKLGNLKGVSVYTSPTTGERTVKINESLYGKNAPVLRQRLQEVLDAGLNTALAGEGIEAASAQMTAALSALEQTDEDFYKILKSSGQATEEKEVVYGIRPDGTFGPLPQ